MSIFSVSVSLAGPPKLYYGFWYSHDSTQTRGHMLTLSNFLASYLSLALGLLVGWAVSCLWRIGCALLFYFSYTPEPSWEESQNNVFIANTSDPLEGFIGSSGILRRRAKAYGQDRGAQYNLPRGNTSPRYRRAKYVIISVMLVGFIAVGLKLAIPLLIALVPLTKVGIVVRRGCGEVFVQSNTTLLENTAEPFVRQARWANAAFAVLDGNINDDLDGSPRPGIAATALPELKKLFTDACPLEVSPCSTEHPFTFSGRYTLSSQHFSLNLGAPFSLHVSDSCYRPRTVVSRVAPAELGGSGDPANVNSTEYGLYYGPRTRLDGVVQKPSMILDEYQASAGSYAIDRLRAVANESSPDGWSPNSTLIRGGDTTLLLYYIGGVLMTNQSSDPIFATGAPASSSLIPAYFTESPFVPVICDTKYVFCGAGGSGTDCSNPGGVQTLLSWLDDRKASAWTDIRTLLAISLAGPPIYRAAFGSAALLAAQSADRGVQFAPNNVTAFRELGRLSEAGMLMLASYAQLSVAGYWKDGPGVVPFTTAADPNSLCNQVLMESSTAATIPVIPYLLFVIFSIIIVAISYSSSFRLSRKLFFSAFDRLFSIWILHLPGQLHREATERLRGRSFKLASVTTKWPDAPNQSGPIVITRKGEDRFSSGNTGLLGNMQDTEEHPLNSFQ